MAIYITVLLALLNQIALKGSKMLIALYAIELGASPFSLGLLIATYACFPLLLAVYAGRASDRVGVRRPMVLGSIGTALGLLVPVAVPTLPALYASAALIGLSNVFFHVSAHNLVGSLGGGHERTRNFATFSLGAAVSGFVGPVVVGFVIDGSGYLQTYKLLACIGAVPGIVLFCFAGFIPVVVRTESGQRAGSMRELLGNRALGRAFVASGLIITGIELFNFYVPIYGRSIGLSASVIGIVLGMQAAAAFVVRLWMPWLSRRFGEERVLTSSLLVAGLTYFLFPSFQDPVVLAGLSFVLGLGLGCGQPLSIILTYNNSPAGRIGESLGFRLTVNKFTQMTIPIAFGSLGAAFGIYPVFWGTACLLIVGGSISAGSASLRPPE